MNLTNYAIYEQTPGIIVAIVDQNSTLYSRWNLKSVVIEDYGIVGILYYKITPLSIDIQHFYSKASELEYRQMKNVHVYKGIGKRMMKYLFENTVNKDLPVFLESSGYILHHSNDINTISNKLESGMIQEILLSFFNNLDDHNEESVKNIFNAFLHNIELATYYNRNYGFEIVELCDPYYFKMKTIVKKALDTLSIS
jgi:hypothetical protein